MPAYKIEVFEEHGRGRKTHWYWRLKTRNGRIVADGAESYSRRAGVMRAIEPIAQGLGAEVWEKWATWTKARKLNGNVVPINPPAAMSGRASG